MRMQPAVTRTGREPRTRWLGALLALTLFAATPAGALPFLYAWDMDAMSCSRIP